MKGIRFLVLAGLVILFISHGMALHGQDLRGQTLAGEEGKAEAVARQLIKTSGADQFGTRVIEQMVMLQQKRMPDIPNQFWEDFKGSVNPEDLVDLIIPIYSKHLSVEEMQALIDFYMSSAGQKLLEKLPMITSETMDAGRKWGAELRMEMTAELQKTDLEKLK